MDLWSPTVWPFWCYVNPLVEWISSEKSVKVEVDTSLVLCGGIIGYRKSYGKRRNCGHCHLREKEESSGKGNSEVFGVQKKRGNQSELKHLGNLTRYLCRQGFENPDLSLSTYSNCTFALAKLWHIHLPTLSCWQAHGGWLLWQDTLLCLHSAEAKLSFFKPLSSLYEA